MKLEIDYVNKVDIDDPKKVSTKGEKEFYITKISILSGSGNLTMFLKAMNKETIQILKPNPK